MTAFETAKKNNVVIVVEPLANIYAYYNKIENQKFIHVNENISEHTRKYLIAHLLYFAIHKNDDFHLLSKDFTESEKAAAMFAFALLQKEEKELSKRLKDFWGPEHCELY